MFESLGTPTSWPAVMGGNRARRLGMRAAGDRICTCAVGSYQRRRSACVAQRSARIPCTVGDAGAASNQGRSLSTAPEGCPPWRRSMASQVTSQVLWHRKCTECGLVGRPAVSPSDIVFASGRFQSQLLCRFCQCREARCVSACLPVYLANDPCIYSLWLTNNICFIRVLQARARFTGSDGVCVLCRPVERMERACHEGTAAVTLLRLVTLDHVVLPPAEVMKAVQEPAPQAAPSS